MYETQARFPSSLTQEEGREGCGTSTAHRVPFRIWWGQSSDHSHLEDVSGEDESAVTGRCRELPMMLLEVQSSLGGKGTGEVSLAVCRFS